MDYWGVFKWQNQLNYQRRVQKKKEQGMTLDKKE